MGEEPETTEVEIEVDLTGLLELPAGRRLQIAAADWVGQGWLAPFASDLSELATLRLREKAWREIATALVTSPPGSDEREGAIANEALLSALANCEERNLQVETVGYVGGTSTRWLVTADEIGSLSTDYQPKPWFERNGASRIIGPIAFAIVNCVWNANRAASNTAAHLKTLNELRKLAQAPTAPIVTFSPHLDGFTLDQVQRVKLGWDIQANGKVYSLETSGVLEDGSTLPVSPGDIAKSGGALRLAASHWALLSSDHEQVIRQSTRYKNRTRREAAPAVLDPSTVVPEGVDLNAVDFSGYSDRVLGFEPLLSQRISIETSEIDWLEGGKGGAAFVTVSFDPENSRPEARLALTVEDARELKSKIDAQLTKPGPSIVEFKGRALPAIPELQAHLANALEVFDRAQLDSGKSKSAPVGRSEGAVIAEADRRDKLGAVDVDVPWGLLLGHLADGIELQSHQKEGIRWLWAHYESARGHRAPGGVLLADDMGLGKTFQVLCFLVLQSEVNRLARRITGPSLVVLPKALMENWPREIAHFFRPGVFDALTILDAARIAREFENGRPASRWYIVSYDALGRHQKYLLRQQFECIVFDESHRLKNPDTLQSRAARGCRFSFAVAMSGTPIENGLPDLWTLLDVATHGRFGALKAFKSEFVTRPPQGGLDRLKTHLAYVPSEVRLESTLLRRTKEDLVQSLPPKREQILNVEMSKEQSEQEAVIVGEARKRPGSFLRALQQLEVLYQHPYIIRAKGQDLRNASASLEAVVRESPKLSACLELLGSIAAASEKALIFTRSRIMQDLLEQVLSWRFGLTDVCSINGTVTAKLGEANRIIDRFSAKCGFDALILSPISGGVGLNIVAANHVIHFGRWWNPAKEDQATDRAYRIGQTRPVTVYYPILHLPGRPGRGFDSRLHELVTRKRKLAKDLFHPADLLEPTNEEVFGMGEEADAS